MATRQGGPSLKAMTAVTPPLRSLHVVIAGGGIAAVEAALALRALTGTALELTMIAPNDRLHYRPLTVVEPFAARATRHYPLDEICHDLGVALRADTLAAVDGAAHEAITGGGARIAYDALIVAVGARAEAALARAHTFFADADPESLHWIVREIEEGITRTVAFVAPSGAAWPLPLYELALMTAARAHDMGIDDAALTLVTPEDEPLAIFRGAGSAAVAGLLHDAGVDVLANAYADAYDGRFLTVMPGDRRLRVERVVALPRMSGPAIEGLPSDPHGFIHADEHGRVPGFDGVYAIGDATTFPVKQGGIAAQRADLVATLIARAAGATVAEPSTRPLLRTVLFTGAAPLYLRATITGGESVISTASRHCPWWPPHKVAARHLAPFLADREEMGPATATRHAFEGPASGEPLVVHHGGGDVGIELLGRDQRAG
jgi:sulfide:quinone oxidoreductase